MDDQTIELHEFIQSLSTENKLTETEKKELGALTQRLAGIEAEIEKSSPQLGTWSSMCVYNASVLVVCSCKCNTLYIYWLICIRPLCVGTLRSQVAQLQRKIIEVGGSKLSRAQAKVDILSKQFDSLNATFSTKEVTNCRKQATKAAAVRSKYEEELKNCQEKLVSLTKEQDEMESDATAVNEAMETAKVKMADQEVILKQITTEFNSLKTSVEKIKGSEIDLAEEIRTSAKVLKENQQKLENHKKNLELLRKCHIDEQREFNTAVNDVMKTKKPAASSASSSSDTGAVAMEEDTSDAAVPVELNLEELPQYTLEELEEQQKDQLLGTHAWVYVYVYLYICTYMYAVTVYVQVVYKLSLPYHTTPYHSALLAI